MLRTSLAIAGLAAFFTSVVFAQESELESSYGAEQARWVEISNRLDELERALARP